MAIVHVHIRDIAVLPQPVRATVAATIAEIVAATDCDDKRAVIYRDGSRASLRCLNSRRMNVV